MQNTIAHQLNDMRMSRWRFWVSKRYCDPALLSNDGYGNVLVILGCFCDNFFRTILNRTFSATRRKLM